MIIRRSPRTTRLTINVTPGRVEVVAPTDAPQAAIDDFVHRKRRWIAEKRQEVDAAYRRLTDQQPTRLRTGAKIPYRGRLLKLTVTPGDVDHIHIDYRNAFHLTVPPDTGDAAIRRELRAWMRYQLAKDCRAFAARYGDNVGAHPTRLSLKRLRDFWGFCDRDGTLIINWHLVFAPKQITEYVVAHEICHLVHRTHSDEFWALLGSVFPAWESCKNWLEASGDGPTW